jgi:hypothetical protein
MPEIQLSSSVRIRDKGDGKWVVEWNNTATGTWEEKLRIDNDTGDIELIGRQAVPGGDVADAATPGNFSADKIITIKDTDGNTWYVPAKAATW